MNIEIPETLNKLASLLPCELYVVGGYIRNSIMDIEKEDIDICGKLKLCELEKILEGSEFCIKVKNKSLGSAIISCGDEKFEYTTFRHDYYAEGGAHYPERVEFVQTAEEDAKRRDFTCNAIYYEIKNKHLLDFYNGIEDIKNKTLKCVESADEVLSHDGLRILRLFRFQCELNFKIDKTTLLAAIKYKNNLRDISGEREISEITRILHSPKKYKSIGKPHSYMKTLKIFNRYGFWQIFGIDCAKIKYNMVKKVIHKSQGLLIDIIDTVNPISISYYLNLILTDSFGMSKKMLDQYINIISGYYEALNKVQNKPYFFKYFNNFPSIYLLLIHKSRYLANKYQFFYKYIISHKLVVSIKDLKISGDDIKKYYPSVNPTRYKPILESLLSDIFDGVLINEKDELITAVEGKLKYL